MNLSVVLPYYRNTGMLRRQLTVWRDEWPANLKEQCEIVLVDDGSPEPAAPVVRSVSGVGIPISIYRVLEDRPWHQHAARNLGAHVAQAPWLLLTDIDHVIPADTLEGALRLARKNKPDRVYTFARRDAPSGEPWRSDHWSTMARTVNDRGEMKPHPNSFCMPREVYWRVGGYHETVGEYGTDRMFRDRLFKAARPFHLAGFPLIRVSRDVIPDASTTTLSRAEGRAVRNKAPRRAGGPPEVLQFPWERVA